MRTCILQLLLCLASLPCSTLGRPRAVAHRDFPETKALDVLSLRHIIESTEGAEALLQEAFEQLHRPLTSGLDTEIRQDSTGITRPSGTRDAIKSPSAESGNPGTANSDGRSGVHQQTGTDAQGKGQAENTATKGEAVEVTRERGDMRRFAAIPGTKLEDVRGALQFRRRWECLLSREASGWEYDPRPRVLPWPEKLPHAICTSKKGYLGPKSNEDVAKGLVTPSTWGVAESLKYIWHVKDPKACPGNAVSAPNFEHLDAEGFCSALQRRGGSLFLVGDSLTGHFWISLRAQLRMMGVHVSPMEPSPGCQEHLEFLSQRHVRPMSGKWPACARHMICGETRESGGVELHFVLSERLWRANASIHSPQWALGFGDEMVANNASVVVLNRGAHTSGTRFFRREIGHTTSALRRLLPDALIVFRSTPEGHPGCQENQKPVEVPLQPKKWPFHWELFAEHNAIARAAVEEVGGIYLDVNPMTSLRPDWHLDGSKHDCLHYCEPGPVDSWVAAFGNMLLELL